MRSRLLIITSALAAALICGGFVARHGWSWRSGPAAWRSLAGPFMGHFVSHRGSRVGGAQLFDAVREHVAQDYVDALSADQIYRTATQGMLHELDDPRTRLLVPGYDGAAGAAGDTVRADVRHGGAARGNAPRGTAQHGVLLERGIGYLAAPVFSDSNGRGLDHAIDSLRARGMRTLLLDLRHNATASLDRGVAAADLFLRPDETVVTIRGRGPGTTRVIVDRSPARWTGLGLIVLIDSSTARGSEVVAGALQDHDRALIVGAPSAGNGGDAALFPVEGGALRLTTARWYTPSGRRIDRMDPRWSEDDADDADAAGDGTDSTAGDSTGASRYRTDAGRAMAAGGAITPDVLVSGDTATPPAAARHDLRADPVIRAALDLAVHAASASDLVLHSVPPAGVQGGGADSSSRGPGTP